MAAAAALEKFRNKAKKYNFKPRKLFYVQFSIAKTIFCCFFNYKSLIFLLFINMILIIVNVFQ